MVVLFSVVFFTIFQLRVFALLLCLPFYTVSRRVSPYSPGPTQAGGQGSGSDCSYVCVCVCVAGAGCVAALFYHIVTHRWVILAPWPALITQQTVR